MTVASIPLRLVFALLLGVAPARAQERDEALLGTSRRVAAAVPDAARRASPGYATWREGKDFGYRLELDSPAVLRVGFFEPVWRHPGQRVFDVRIHDEVVVAGLDLPVVAGKAPSYVEQRFDVVPRDGRLAIAFRASRGEAIVAWLRLEHSTTGELLREIDCGGDGDLRPEGIDGAGLSVEILPRFGARAYLELRAPFGDATFSPLGKFREPPSPFVAGFVIGGKFHALPFGGPYRGPLPFTAITSRRTATRLRYEVEADDFRGAISFHAPFDPGDLQGSTLPAIEIEFEVLEWKGEGESATVEAQLIVFTPPGMPREHRRDGFTGVSLERADGARVVSRGLFVSTADEAAGAGTLLRPRGLELRAKLAAGGRVAAQFVQHVEGPLLEVSGVPHRAAYAVDFGSIVDCAAAVFARRDALAEGSRLFDSLVEDAVLPEGLADVLRVALPSFLLNTVATASASGDRFFSCLEGYCRFHATVDVDFNAAPFYLWFAPHLLRSLLERWAACVTDDVVCHDLGSDDVVGVQKYPHAMPIEENTNFVLLAHLLWTHDGDDEFAASLAPLIERLLARVRACDVDRDFLPEEGVANTIDDGSAAVQYSRDQTYLAVKIAAAHRAGAELVELAGGDGAELLEHAASIAAALEERSWRGTHYALTADPATAGLVNPWTRGKGDRADVVPEAAAEAMPDGELLFGADSPHGLAALGSFFALRTLREPPIPAQRLAADLTHAMPRIARDEVLAHAEHEMNGWVSLALLRDATALMLGIDASANAKRYAALQRSRNRLDDVVDWAGFCDSPYNRYLSYYPRGVAALSLVEGLAGMRLDRRARRLVLEPAVAPLRVPLGPLADWKARRVPWLDVRRNEDGEVIAELSEESLLAGYEVTLDLRRVGGEVKRWTVR
jgi:hypothetical protein